MRKSRFLASQNPPQIRRTARRCPGVSEQCVGYTIRNTCRIYLREGPPGPKDQSSSKSGTALGAMLAPFFALGRFLAAFCVSCCVCCRSWSVFVRLGALRARFWRGQGRSGEGFGGPRALFFEVFECFCLLSRYCGVDAPNLTKHWQEWYKTHIGACRASSARRKKREKHGPAAS